ncbi:MAG: hypothetical protein JSR46_06595 [Verrucomicrobia bacterium]|nr:hypothetical protein [Verrucomicrobiota bacterium]
MKSCRNIIATSAVAVLTAIACNSTEKNGSQPAATSLHPAKSSWVAYDSPSGDFSVRFPSPPQHVSEVSALPNDSKMVKYDIYLAQEKDGSTFMISRIQYPTKFDEAHHDTVLEGVMKEMVGGNPTNVLVKTTKGTFLNNPSLDFSIKNSDFSVHSRAMICDTVLYVLTVMDRDPNFIEQDFKAFEDSFVLKSSK